MCGKILIFNDVDILLDALLKQWQDIAVESIADHGFFHVALAGGSTPRGLYARLAKMGTETIVEWDKVHIYFGDERSVPQDHEESNYRMAHETLLSHVAIPESQVHVMYQPSEDAEQSIENSAKESAALYSDILKNLLSQDANGNPVFDLILLGMGEDGHTASLFPGTEILNESHKSVSSQFVEKLDTWRVSLTYPTINAARHVAILVVGDTKASVLADILNPSTPLVSENSYPIQQVNPKGNLQWYLDSAAANLIKEIL